MPLLLAPLLLLTGLVAPDTCGNPPLEIIGPINGPGLMPPTSVRTFHITPVPDATHYIWTVPQGTLINGMPGPQTLAAPGGNSAAITFGYQEGKVCVAAANACDTSTSACILVTALLTDVPVCPGNDYPAADICELACVFCQLEKYQGTSAGYQSETMAPLINCNMSIQNDQWMAFVAGDTMGTIEVRSFNCKFGNGLQVLLYDDCAGPDLYCDPGFTGGEGFTLSLTPTNLVPGNLYYIRIDGYSGDECNFELSAYPQKTFQALPLGPTPPIIGPDTLCRNGNGTFAITPVNNAGNYFWSGPPGSTINGVPTPNLIEGNDGLSVSITLGNTPGNVCVTPVNSCRSGVTKCLPVQILDSLVLFNIFPPDTICYYDGFYTLPWGEVVSYSGLFQHTLTSSKGCDSVLIQQLTVLPPKFTQLPNTLMCAGDTLWICNTPFTESGMHEVTCSGTNGCDSIVTVSLIAVDATISIQEGYDTLDCRTPWVELRSNLNPGTKTWRRLPAGNIVGTGQILKVSQPGLYEVTNQFTNLCIHRDTALVIGRFEPPGALASGGHLDCYNNGTELRGESLTTGAEFFWSGPNGFTSPMANPRVTLAGLYLLTVTHPDNGCIATDTAWVSGSTAPLLVTATGTQQLDCIDTLITLSAMVAQDGAFQYTWSGPNGFSAQSDSLAISTPGQYSVMAIDSVTGCNGSAVITVEADTLAPVLTVGTPDLLTCTRKEVSLHAESNPPGLISWQTPNLMTISGAALQANVPGTYTATALNSLNGCRSIQVVMVSIDTTPPVIQLDTVGPDLDQMSTGFIRVNVYPETNIQLNWYAQGILVGSGTSLDGAPAGAYTLVAEPENGCVDSLTVIIDMVSGNDRVLVPASGWSVFPNPVSGTVHIRNRTGVGRLSSCRVVDSSGRLALQKVFSPGEVYQVDVSALPAGAYILWLHTEDSTFSVCMTKQ